MPSSHAAVTEPPYDPLMNTGDDMFRALMKARIQRDSATYRTQAASAATRAEAMAVLSGASAGKPLTPLQERISEDVNETNEHLTALFAALGMPEDTDDPRVHAGIHVVGTLLARIVHLEARLTALERTANG